MSNLFEKLSTADGAELPSVPGTLFVLGWPIFGTLLLIFILLREAYRTDYPKVANIPEVPGPYPFVGHLPFLGGRLKENDANIFSKWSRQISSGVFQIKLGRQRTVIVGSWSTMKDLFITENSSMLDRPHQRGFIDHIGVDVSGSPMTSQIKKCRTAAVRALGKPNWSGYFKLIEPSLVRLVRALYENGGNGKKPMEMYPWLRQMMFDLALNMTYGARASDFDDALTNRLLESLYTISECRGSTASYRHYVPFFRLWPERKSKLITAANQRDECVNILYGWYLQKVSDGKKPHCLVSSLSADKLTLDELHGTCMSLLQAALDTVSSSTYQCFAWLCSPEGQPFQEECLKAILEAYDGDRDQA